MTAYTIDVPGALVTFLDGSGAVQGDPYSQHPDSERGAQELRAAYKAASSVRRGRGYALRLELPSIDAVLVLAEYAATCLSANYGGDLDYSEARAARAVLGRAEHVTGGRVAFDGYWVRLDGEVTA